MWRMIHEANAIEAMAVNIRFSEPAGSLLTKRIISGLTSATNAEGLIDRRPLQGFQVNIANPSEVRPMTGGAMVFQRTSLEKDAEGDVQSILTNQLEVHATHLTYQTWRYANWTSEAKTVRNLLVPALALASQGVAIAAVRLEYLDRFYFDGEASAASAGDLLKSDSGLLAPHIFEAPNLWHSHTGKFEDENDVGRRLLLVNADYQDLTGPALVGKRSLQLMTAVEEQYAHQGKEVSSEEVESFLSSTLDDLHDKLIALFKEVVNAGFAKENGLPHV